MNQYLLKI